MPCPDPTAAVAPAAAAAAAGPACPRNTEWLVTSNGDNDYDPEFLATAVKQGQQADVVAFDYYSRFQRPTGEAAAAGVAASVHTEQVLVLVAVCCHMELLLRGPCNKVHHPERVLQEPDHVLCCTLCVIPWPSCVIAHASAAQ
jgi:endonuclease/exonuclease/phosphatase (EEP) superfamily protein YafD